jgi:type IV pilus biogenesis protein PilP
MTADRAQLPPTSNRQKIVAAIVVVVVLVILWQVISLFRGGDESTPTPVKPAPGMHPASAPPMMPMTPQHVSVVPKPTQELTPEEANNLRLQQANEARYLNALNELQMLRLERDIVETNRAIMAAKLETVAAEKNIVTLLQPPQIAPNSYAKGLVSPTPSTSTTTTTTQQTSGPNVTVSTTTVVEIAPYTVVSVAQIERKWNAVLGLQGNLYSVSIGDVLPPDGSRVIGINQMGVELEKANVKKRISLVPII